MAKLPATAPAPLRRLAIVLALVALVLAPATATHAQESPAEIEDQIEAKWRKLEPLIEQFNKVRSELKANQKKSKKLAEKIKPLEESVGAAESELADIAVQQFKSGPVSVAGALLSTGSPTSFVDRLATLDQIARDQQARIKEASDQIAEYEDRKAEIDALVEEQQRQKEDLTERKKAIEADLEELDVLLQEAEEAQAAAEVEQVQQVQQPSGSCPAVSSSGPGAVAANFACGQIGEPYVFGANGPASWDCSGLTQQAWAQAGVSLTHHTGAQWNEAFGVSRDNAIPGDLVFFYSDLSHVGVYIGSGLMVHAPRPGLSVQVGSIDVMPIAGFRRPG
jgi:cell wall-associated NlpC family hydrolase